MACVRVRSHTASVGLRCLFSIRCGGKRRVSEFLGDPTSFSSLSFRLLAVVEPQMKHLREQARNCFTTRQKSYLLVLVVHKGLKPWNCRLPPPLEWKERKREGWRKSGRERWNGVCERLVRNSPKQELGHKCPPPPFFFFEWKEVRAVRKWFIEARFIKAVC